MQQRAQYTDLDGDFLAEIINKFEPLFKQKLGGFSEHEFFGELAPIIRPQTQVIRDPVLVEEGVDLVL